jgi:parvulin-like peptidyl-prolyl isomerase
LSKTGEADAIAAQGLSLIQGLSDQEIQNAIEELKRSTAAIEKQTEALRLQQNAINALVKNDKKAAQSRSHSESAQVRKWEVKKGHITSAVGMPDDQYIYCVLQSLD